MTKSDFYLKWGSQWKSLVMSPMWNDAMEAAQNESQALKIPDSNEEIDKYGALILKGMKHFLEHETILARLADKPLNYEPLKETYPNQAQEALAQLQELQQTPQPVQTNERRSRRRKSS